MFSPLDYKSLQKLDHPIIIDLRNNLQQRYRNKTDIFNHLQHVLDETKTAIDAHMLSRQNVNLWSSQFEMPVYPWLLPCDNFPYCRTDYHAEYEDFSYLFPKAN